MLKNIENKTSMVFYLYWHWQQSNYSIKFLHRWLNHYGKAITVQEVSCWRKLLHSSSVLGSRYLVASPSGATTIGPRTSTRGERVISPWSPDSSSSRMELMALSMASRRSLLRVRSPRRRLSSSSRRSSVARRWRSCGWTLLVPAPRRCRPSSSSLARPKNSSRKNPHEICSWAAN